MFPIMTTEAGNCAGFPDVCKTPSPGGPVPVPYPNIAQCSDGAGSKKVKIRNKEVLRKGDSIRLSSGNEAGTAGGGLVSGKIKGQAEIMVGQSQVRVEGKDVAYLTARTGQNGGSSQNALSALASVYSQSLVQVYRRVRQKQRLVLEKADTYKSGTTVVPKTAGMDQQGKKAHNDKSNKKHSEELGEMGGKNAAKQLAAAHGGINEMAVFAGKGVVDIIAKCKDGVILVIECKGGTAGLCVRQTANYGRAIQGTPPYLEDIADNMGNCNPDKYKTTSEKQLAKKKRNMGRALTRKLKRGYGAKVKYYHARTKYGPNGSQDTTVKEFDP